MAPSAKAQFAKAYKAMKKLGYQGEVVKPVLQQLLKLYEKEWLLIEENNYQVLADAILDSEEQKARQNEAEEIEPPLKKSKLGSKGRQSPTSPYASVSDSSNIEKNQPYGMLKLLDEDIELRTPHVTKCSQITGQSSSTPLTIVEEANEIQFGNDNESDNCNPLETLAHLKNSGDESCKHYGFPEKRLKTYERQTNLSRKKGRLLLIDENDELEDMEIDKHLHDAASGSTPPVHKDACFVENKSDLDENNSEPMLYELSELEKNKDSDEGSLKLDVASSSGGEVKIFLTAKSSQKSDAYVPSLETVMKQVEEQCRKSYKMSMLTLMKEVCECFLVVVNPEISKDRDLETGSVEGIDCQLTLCLTNLNNPSGIQNFTEVLPQIPRFVGSTELDLSCCTIYLNVDPKRFGGMERMENNYCSSSSSRIMIVQKCYYNFITDISKGQEAYKVSLINEVNEEQGPTFNYIPRNMTYHNAYGRFLLSHVSEEICCSFGDCLSLGFPCACAGKTGNEFAYTTGCLLKEKFLDNVISKNYSALQHKLFYCQDCPIERCKDNISSCKCKGHIERSFIRECWHKCGCSINCGNRVVQQGIKAKLQVFRTPGQKGWGLRTLENIPKGAFICEYVGEVITSRESHERNLHNTVLLDADWNSKGVLKDEEALCLDATIYGNVARFINHRCFDANLVEVPVEVETQDHKYYHLALFATRKIDAFEELTWDYGIDFYHPVKAFQCLCGSNFCRDRKSLKRMRNSC